MRIETDTNHQWSQSPRPSIGNDSNPSAFASFLVGASSAEVGEPDASSAVAPAESTIDFSNATRQEVFDWMNSQIRSGAMTVHESTPFLGMTLKISAATGEPVDMATDNERINFQERANRGIEGALARLDFAAADRLRAAIDIMQRYGAEL